MVPKSSSDMAASRFSSTANVALAASFFCRFGDPDLLPPPRASVKCGLNTRSSRGMPSSAVAASMRSASSTSFAPPSIPIQNTRAALAVGKNPYPPVRISNALLSTRRKRLVIASTRSAGCSPINYSVICNDSGRTQRASGAKLSTPSMKREMRARTSGSRSMPINIRMTMFV